MTDAPAPIERPAAHAADGPAARPPCPAWARVQAIRALARAANAGAGSGADVVYRRTWPSPEAIELLSELEYDPVLAWEGWLDSTLDLRDGLSVVEVFAPAVEPQEALMLAAAWR